ncbi:hypothetical protein GCM10010465_11370 [Actinomadura fibrosa]
MLFNCSTKDLEYIDPYEFVSDDFEDIGEMPPVEDQDPEFTAPALGSVQNSAATQAIITDLGSGGLSTETQASLTALQNFSATLPAGVAAEAQALTEAQITAIMSTENFDGELANLESLLDDLPAEIAALLPSIQFTADYTGTASAAADAPFNTSFRRLAVAQAVTGPCAEAVQEAYAIVMEELTTTRDAQLASIQANYTRRLTEADARYESRLATLNADYDTYKAELTAVAVDLLQLAVALETTEPAIADQLKLAALIYAVEASSSLTAWYTAAVNLLEQKRTEEKAAVLTIKEALTATVNANFAALKAEADAALQQALNNCHNQGSGN